MTAPAITEDVTVKILQARPGDVVVLSWPCPISPETAEQIKTQAAIILPASITVIVMDNGGGVDSVLRPE